MMAGVRWIVFDAVGTLLRADPPVAEAYRAAGHAFGSRYELEEIRARLRHALAAEFDSGPELVRPPTSEFAELARWRRIVAEVFDDVPSEHAGRLFQSLWLHFGEPAHWRLYDDVEPTLRRLAERGSQLAIASNFDGRLLKIVAGMPGLAACQRVFVSSRVGFAKPDRRFFATVANELDVSSDEVLLVGDDWQADIVGARAAGWRAIWLQRQPQPSNEPHIQSLAELLDS